MAVIQKLIREPLLHFLLIGAGLFALFYQLSDPADNLPPNRITITQADIKRLETQWQRQWKRLPSDRELAGLVDSHVRELILYREALGLGLDKDDVIVRRRLGQKLEFMFKDLAEQAEPAEDELQQFLEDNVGRYTDPERFTFTHLYFSRDKHGDSTENEAIRARELLISQSGAIDPVTLSDRFLHQYRFDNQSTTQISRIFGKVFTDNLSAQKTGEWVGPIESGYGLHLVFISDRTIPRQPTLVDVREKVRWDVISERRNEMDAAFYKGLRQRYDVEIEQPDGS